VPASHPRQQWPSPTARLSDAHSLGIADSATRAPCSHVSRGAQWRQQQRVLCALSGTVVSKVTVTRMQGHLMLSTDALETFLDAGDEGLEAPERIFNLGTSFNTGGSLFKVPSKCIASSGQCQPQMTPHSDVCFGNDSSPMTACSAAVRSQRCDSRTLCEQFKAIRRRAQASCFGATGRRRGGWRRRGPTCASGRTTCARKAPTSRTRCVARFTSPPIWLHRLSKVCHECVRAVFLDRVVARCCATLYMCAHLGSAA